MRVIVKFPRAAYPELVAELEGIVPRERAERLRLLASLGVTMLRWSPPQPVSTPATPSAAEPVQATGPTPTTRLRQIRERLRDGAR